MKNITKILSLLLALTLLLSFPVAASAVELTNMPTIDESKTGSLTIYKYDLTNAEKDGVWDSSYVSTGVYDEAGVNNVLGGSTSSALGNGETGYGYAIKGIPIARLAVAQNLNAVQSLLDQTLCLQSLGIDDIAGIESSFQISHVDDGVLGSKDVVKANLGQAACQRHLAALETSVLHAGTGLLALAAEAGSLAIAGANAAALAGHSLVCAGNRVQFMKFHYAYPP